MKTSKSSGIKNDNIKKQEFTGNNFWNNNN